MARFICYQATGGNFVLVNFEQVRMIERLGDNNCRVFLGGGDVINMEGEAASTVLSTVFLESELVNGEPFADLIGKPDHSGKIQPREKVQPIKPDANPLR
jgi:hypothetical protein